MRLVAAAAFLVLLIPFRAAAVTTTADPERPTLMQVNKDGSRSELPLVKSRLRCEVRGPIAQVTLVQSFHNSSTDPIEAVYVFPMHERAAVGGMTMHLGARTIHAVIRKRSEAVAQYEQAKADGKAAALLQQERPNVFTQSVANILPGEQIDVELTYDVLLEPDGGEYELALPTVVGPRYIPGTAVDRPQSGGGRIADTDQVPDASRITPPVAPPGESTGHDYGLDLDLDAGFPVTDVTSPTHAIVVTTSSTNLIHVALADGAVPADKDLVVRWRIAVDKPTLAVLADKSDRHGHVALVLAPPPSSKISRAPREMVFVLDTSGSMSGEPLALVRRGIRRALQDLQPGDAFRIINFSTDVSGFRDGKVLPATRENLNDARSWLNGTMADGGTEMIKGVRAALPGTPANGRTRYVVFMTDGYIGNDEEIIAAVKELRDPDTHLFSFGTGSSVNRYLMDEMAKAGDGVATYLLLDEDPAGKLDDFFGRISTPALTDIKVNWGGLAIEDPAPARFGSLFADRPLVITTRYTKAGSATIEVTGKHGEEEVKLKIPVELPSGPRDGEVLGRLWARKRIGESKDEQEITRIALDYSLMSAYTAFVAVDDTKRVDRPGDAIQVPVDLPEGVEYEAVVGGYNAAYGNSAGEVITISGTAPIIDQGSTSTGITIDAEYTKNIPLPGRTFTSALGAAYGSAYDGDGVEADTTYVVGGALPRWRLSLSASGGYDLDGNRPLAGFSSSIERRIGDVIAVGATGNLWRLDDENLLSVLATVSRWSLLRLFDLRLGLGVASLQDQTALSWQIRLSAPLPLGGMFQPELGIGIEGAALEDDQGVLNTSLGIGVRF